MNNPEQLLKKHKGIYDVCFGACQAGKLELNQWESEFLDSIGEQLRNNKYLSFKQFQCLNKIQGRIE